ncbi:MAG: DUF4011 domain-containing protein [Bacteroidales bacterium]|nr:DUF4011 domain-containing protein [Bacteroidales bacterium]
MIKIDFLPSVNYSMMNNGVKVCNSLILENDSDDDWHRISVRISGPFIKESSCLLEELRKGQSAQINNLVTIEPDIKVLSEITEAVKTSFILTIKCEEEILEEQEYPITLLSYEEWSGSSVMPEHLAAFVVPNNPYLSKIKLEAAKFLEQWTGSSSFDEYQTQDRNRVRAQVAAIYEALRSEGIIYSAPPASFEKTGQRIRLADRVLTEKIGTCLDTSLLIASCLEEIGIYPIIVILNGHALVGAWLIPNVFQQMVCDDASYLLKEMADGNNNLVLLESTFITSSDRVSFEDAVKTAMLKVRDESQFLYFIDIHRCRLGNIRPMPQRIQVDGGWTFVNEGLEHENATETVNTFNHYDLRLEDTGRPTTKQMIWERKLLDFSLRNNLLNTRLGRKVVPFISFEIENLEDHLQNGEDYHITPSPGKKIEPNNGMYDSKQQAVEYETCVSELIRDHKIASYLTPAELENALKYVYRTARTSLEENGANSLFLALGMLKWYETSKSEQPRYAPILLMPVDIVRKSSSNYIIRKRDEEMFLNITLVELLKQNFNINLEGLKELPKDENGVDVSLVFTYFRRAILQQKKWNVIEESMLGLFSFNKFVMWNDIHSNADKLRENVIVASLMESRDKQEADTNAVDARVIDKESAPLDFAIPLDVDSSQMEAIAESGRGRSFILHGPPGTGKSQTITNMIANALYQGKRVLFVAEKMAALSVVQSRLEKINLAPFCLELHSNKVTKKHFLEQMEEVLKVARIKSPEEYAQRSEELYNERKGFISYMEALHDRGANGLSLYDCISGYVSIEEDETSGEIPPSNLISARYLEQCREQEEQTAAVLKFVGAPNKNPLYGLEPFDNKNSTLDGIKALLQEFKDRYALYLTQRGKLNSLVPLDLKTDADARWLELFAKTLRTEKDREALYENALASYNGSIVQMDVNSYLREWQEIKAKWFIPRYFAKKNYLKMLQQAYGPIFESNVESVFKSVSGFQELGRLLQTQTEEVSAFAHSHRISHPERYEAYCKYLGDQVKAQRQAFVQQADMVVKLNHELNSLTERIEALASVQDGKAGIINHVDQWLGHYQHINDWYHWIAKKRELRQKEENTVVELIEEGVQPSVATNAFLKSIYHTMIKEIVDENEQLRMFNGLKFRQQIEKYKRDTARFQELSKEALYSKLASRVPFSSAAIAEGSEMSILKRNIANGGRGSSIRSIIENIPTLLPRLCPCMLMSPISVAQFIDMNSEKFDLVIFDEASQMPTSEAVGAIARGKALVVVGDSKQMPPTSFFTTNQVDEDEADIDDMESILDDCITLSLCEHQLNWHYRSKHESLIAFSNSQYYGNRLLTFPSIDDRVTKVTLVPVNGVYDKGRTRSNSEESKAIVAEIVRRLSDPVLQKQSIGVVAFSRVQGDLIEDDLMDALDRNPQLKAIAFDGKEPIFVKNLENVQGDERDVILFSIGYGADKHGKVSMNFGPLNNTGGERRLNVAVSRARYEMIVYSTLKASQIDLKRSNAKGVEGLKAFLEYAETGRLPFLSNGIASKSENSVMVNQICEALHREGFLTESFVGRSDFKVDIAVSTREHPDQYILGILCDGKTYYETKTTRDREIVQPGVLKMLGWRVMRVFSLDWYENKERALEQILQELKAAVEGVVQQEPEEEDSYVFDAEQIKDKGFTNQNVRNKRLLLYFECPLSTFPEDKSQFDPHDSIIPYLIEKILKVEQPVTEYYLCKRMAKVFGFEMVGANIQRAVAYAVKQFYQDPYSIAGERSFWLREKDAQNYLNYRVSERPVTDIPAIEIMNAVREVVEEEFSVPKDKIPSLAARKLGFSRKGAKINDVILVAIELLEKAGIIIINNDYISLC